MNSRPFFFSLKNKQSDDESRCTFNSTPRLILFTSNLAELKIFTHPSGENPLNKKTYDEGMAVRREVLGAEYVDRAMASADQFTRVLYEFVTEWCWGAIWTRPGLSRKTRSLINLAMLTALNRPHEIKLHVRGALNNGVTREEMTEVFLQAGVYAGVPAAVDAFRAAKEVFDAVDKE
jgi:4-carboxymuconolactone decarboxylase